MSAGVERTYAAVQTAAVQRASGAGVLAQAGGCDGRPGLAGGGGMIELLWRPLSTPAFASH